MVLGIRRETRLSVRGMCMTTGPVSAGVSTVTGTWRPGRARCMAGVRDTTCSGDVRRWARIVNKTCSYHLKLMLARLWSMWPGAWVMSSWSVMLRLSWSRVIVNKTWSSTPAPPATRWCRWSLNQWWPLLPPGSTTTKMISAELTGTQQLENTLRYYLCL